MRRRFARIRNRKIHADIRPGPPAILPVPTPPNESNSRQKDSCRVRIGSLPIVSSSLLNIQKYKRKKPKPVHNTVISGFQAVRQARVPVAVLKLATEGSCRSHGGLASHCATDAPGFVLRQGRYTIWLEISLDTE
ncbi:hypothetical protein PoB_003749000 [Plakobranchus ocellatus]|uniref:Uncharacterized protein n=1 Tax=Plakobranchus ocellatus TaxID=259542 RepID=A0AAV4AUK2_9GAST|nr:hypothetical protein PoB_003749000 [Plakobranchus ocellatus]